MNADQFHDAFFALTGNAPLSWQSRLFRDHFVKNELSSCSVIDLPTGLGKTMVIAIWLIARAVNESLPRRLVYVVDRRTVVDQATTLATKLQRRVQALHRLARRRPELKPLCESFPVPAISTLRGQLADNREWSRDLAKPAIIIGTVDLIGSALLFSGYRSSYKRRPLEAGLLGQDSLLVLDEAHLSKPFEKLICAIGDGGPFQKNCDDNMTNRPMRVIRMSATSEQPNVVAPSLTLQLEKNGNLTADDAKDAVVAARFSANKRLTITTLGEKDDLNHKLAVVAVELARRSELCGKRIVVFVRSPQDARDIAENIRNHGKPAKSKSNSDPKGPYSNSVAVLTGTLRGLERDKLLTPPETETDHARRVMQRFVGPIDDPSFDACFLISTSAGEVGFDLNADHLIGDAAPLDSWIQRLGRVNRRGQGTAHVEVFVEPQTEKDKQRDGGKHTVASASIQAMAALRQLPHAETLESDIRPGPIFDASPRSLCKLPKPHKALSPAPTMVELTDILLDAWSMTSITGTMPGRPEVGPWLRGIDDTQAQTTVAWRAELELFRDDPSADKSMSAVFVKHPIRAHESLTVNTGYLLEFLRRIAKLKDRPADLMSTRAAVRLPRGKVVCRTLQQLIDEPGILYADSTLILPARFGGLDASGMLDAESVPKKRNDGDPEPPSLDEADHIGYEQTDAIRSRLRIVIKRSEDGLWTPLPLPGGSIANDVRLEEVYAKSTKLFDDLKSAKLRVRLRQPICFDIEDDAVESLVALAPAFARKANDDQPLTEHVGAVEAEAERIADTLGLAEDNPVRIALQFAAKWHDEGKKAEIWQRFVYGEPGAYKGKSSKTRDPKSLRGYRHEFGSLLRIHHRERCGTTDCELPNNADARELALHLIATHHGLARPHFSSGIYHDFTDAERDAIHSDCIRRFARLQRKYGRWHLAWLENLLRCADALASADQDSEDDPADAEGDAA